MGVGVSSCWRSHRLVERQIEEELDKADQIPTAAAAVAIEQILSGVDVEERRVSGCKGHRPTNSWRVPARQGFQLWRCKYSSSGMRCLSRSRFSAMVLFSPPESRVGGSQPSWQGW